MADDIFSKKTSEATSSRGRSVLNLKQSATVQSELHRFILFIRSRTLRQRWYTFDELCRIPGYDSVSWYIPGHDTGSTDFGVIAYRNTGKYCGFGTNPSVSAYVDGLTCYDLPLI